MASSQMLLALVCLVSLAINIQAAEEAPLVQQGLDLLQAGNYDGAISKFTEHLQNHPNDPFAYNDRGIAYKSKNDFKHAVEDFSEALRKKPNWWIAQFNRGVSYQGEGVDDAAIADFTKALKHSSDLGPLRRDCLLARAHSYFNKMEAALAMSDLNTVIKLGSKDPDAFVLRGVLHKIDHHYDRSLADYEKTIALDPTNAGSYSTEAYLLSVCPNPKYRDAKKAIAYATKACELNDWKAAKDVETLAAAYAENSQFDEAIKWQETAGKMDLKAVDPKREDLYRQKQPFRDINRKEEPFANLTNIKDKISIKLGEKLNARFEMRGDDLVVPQISAEKERPDSLSLDFHQEKRHATLYLTHSFGRTFQARCLARLKDYDTYFETNILPVPVRIISPEIWPDPIEELVLFDLKLIGPSQLPQEKGYADVTHVKSNSRNLMAVDSKSF